MKPPTPICCHERTNRRQEPEFRIVFLPWRWRGYIPPKRSLTLNGLHAGYIPQDSTLHNHRCENLNSYILKTIFIFGSDVLAYFFHFFFIIKFRGVLRYCPVAISVPTSLAQVQSTCRRGGGGDFRVYRPQRKIRNGILQIPASDGPVRGFLLYRLVQKICPLLWPPYKG
jgi:hypothetical protein